MVQKINDKILLVNILKDHNSKTLVDQYKVKKHLFQILKKEIREIEYIKGTNSLPILDQQKKDHINDTLNLIKKCIHTRSNTSILPIVSKLHETQDRLRVESNKVGLLKEHRKIINHQESFIKELMDINQMQLDIIKEIQKKKRSKIVNLLDLFNNLIAIYTKERHIIGANKYATVWLLEHEKQNINQIVKHIAKSRNDLVRDLRTLHTDSFERMLEKKVWITVHQWFLNYLGHIMAYYSIVCSSAFFEHRKLNNREYLIKLHSKMDQTLVNLINHKGIKLTKTSIDFIKGHKKKIDELKIPK